MIRQPKRLRENSPPQGAKRRATSPPLPPGWSRWHDKTGRPYFINDEDGSTTWEDPRAPCEPPSRPPRHNAPREDRQKPRREPRYEPLESLRAFQTTPQLPVDTSAHGTAALSADEGYRGDQGSKVQLHISGLDANLTDSDLRAHLTQFSNYILRISRAKNTEKYCFVHFGENLDAAVNAVAMLDGSTCKGRRLTVALTKQTAERFGLQTKPAQAVFAQPQMPFMPESRMASPSTAATIQPLQVSSREDVQVHLGGLHNNTTQEDVRHFMRSFSSHITKVYIKTGGGYGFVHMDSISAAVAATKKLDGKMDNYDRRVSVQLSSDTAARYGKVIQKANRTREQPNSKGGDEDVKVWTCTN